MKYIFLALMFLAPSFASAQIFPLTVYADAARAQSDQKIKFMHSIHNGVYVGLCKPRPDNDYFCDLAKDGRYETQTGVAFSTKNMGQLFSVDGKRRCTYTEQATLECND